MSLNQQPLVSFIILNWNQTDITCAFLDSCKKLIYPNFEIIIIDQNSTVDPTPQIESGNYPNTKVIRLEKNIGFTGGNNYGMREAKGDYYFIVNNDTEVTPNLIEMVLEPFENDSTIGVVSPKIRFFSDPEIIQYAGFNEINLFTGRTTSVGYGEVDKGQHDKPGYTFGSHGAAMLVKKSVADKVGMFPEKFFIYYEEWDWSMRIIKAGYKIYYQPKGLIFHKESITMGKESAIKAYYHNRNRVLLMRRHGNPLQVVAFILFFIIFTIPKTTFKYASKGQWKHLHSFYRAIWWNLTHNKNSKV
jgi:GT2 family glycosyltransferase